MSFIARAQQRCPRNALLSFTRSLHSNTINNARLRARSNGFGARVSPQKRYIQIEKRNTMGGNTPATAAVTVLVGIGLWLYFKSEKAKLLEEQERERATRSYGRASVGGPFSLTTHDGKPFTQDDMLGKWSLVYFGFTNCPDICPAELDKISSVLDVVEKQHGQIFLPLFVSVDPSRDTPARIQTYLGDFHSRFLGLIGSYDETKKVCKAYRVYFSTPPNADPQGDYLVDHSIFIYLMDPQGRFVDAFGQQVTTEEIITRINDAVSEWEKVKLQKT